MTKTGLKDKHGVDICVGDTIEFFFDADRGYSDSEEGGYTRMIDTVVEKDGGFYFWNEDVKNGAYAWRHAPHCSIILDVGESAKRLTHHETARTVVRG